MIDENDWRLLNATNSLREKKLYRFEGFKKFSDEWDHEHCRFCMATFSEYDCDLREGYMDTKINQRGTLFICDICFEDFKEMFQWEVYIRENSEKD